MSSALTLLHKPQALLHAPAPFCLSWALDPGPPRWWWWEFSLMWRVRAASGNRWTTNPERDCDWLTVSFYSVLFFSFFYPPKWFIDGTVWLLYGGCGEWRKQQNKTNKQIKRMTTSGGVLKQNPNTWLKRTLFISTKIQPANLRGQ